MENQHRKIKGYRELSEYEIELMNEIKELASKTGDLIDGMIDDTTVDHRWISIGKTQLQQGFMALTRAVAKPDFF